jgi:predicted ATPase/DNA-binding CsgD family transcriptional regulator
MDKVGFPANNGLLEPLTWREQDVLSLLAERHTDREIAQALGVELTTVKWYNKQLYSKLGVGSRYQAVAKAEEYGLLDEPTRDPIVIGISSKSNLPVQITSFVGRATELADVKRLVGETHLLTLTGPAGAGKTRLATQAASELVDADAFKDGIFFIDLAPIKQPEMVADTIAGTLGVQRAAGQPIYKSLAIYLGNKHSLLLLDNFEHVIEAVPLVGDLLSAAPDLKILTTSREALRLYGEQEYPVPPLGLPDLSNPESLAAVTDYEAVALFIQRAQAVKPDFAITTEDAPVLAEICVRLDGLPLAIELAAAQVKLFSPPALLGQLESRLTTLQHGPRGLPERQRTLRGAIDWSYELLEDAEKTLFVRLSVFQGGCTIEAVQAVCCHDLPVDALDGLASLLNKNLLRHEEDPQGEPRFTMLETIHEYGRERLQDSGQAEDTHHRHAEYFTSLAERAEPYTRGGPHQLRWLRRLETEHENMRAMYAWSMQGGDIELGLRLVGVLAFFWWRQGHYAEGQKWTTQAVEESSDAPVTVHANVLFAAGFMSKMHSHYERSKHLFRTALEHYRDLGSRRDIGWTLFPLSFLSHGQPDEYEQAVADCEESLALLRELDDKPGVAQALMVRGEIARRQGDLPCAKEAYQESLDIGRETGDKLREGVMLGFLGLIALREGDDEQAQAQYQQSLSLSVEIGHKVGVVDALAGLAEAAEYLGQLERAARLFSAADAFYEMHGFVLQAVYKLDYERRKGRVREQLDKATFEVLWAEGQAMSLEEAIAYALEESASDL